MGRAGVLLVLVAVAAASCRGSNAGCDAAVDHAAPLAADASNAPDLSPLPLAPACGGTVEVTGTTPSGPFSAQYVSASFTPCGGELFIVIAQSDSRDSGMIRIELVRRPQTSSFLGPGTVTVTYFAPGPAAVQSSVGATVDITTFPPTIYMDQDGGQEPVAGTISIDANGLSVSGSFSSRICAVTACG